MHVSRHNSGYAAGRVRPTQAHRALHVIGGVPRGEDYHLIADGESGWTAGGVDTGFETIDMAGNFALPITPRVVVHMGNIGGAANPRIEHKRAA